MLLHNNNNVIWHYKYHLKPLTIARVYIFVVVAWMPQWVSGGLTGKQCHRPVMALVLNMAVCSTS